MKIIIIILLSALTYMCDNQTKQSMMFLNHKKEDDCLTNDNFNLVKKYLIKNGEQVKLFKAGIMTDTNTWSMQLLIKNKTIALIKYQHEYQILVINTNDKGKIPVYFVSDKNNPCEISAYYSVLDTDESIRMRKNNWCEIFTKIKNDKNDSLALIDQKTALEIAQKDALTAYRDISMYIIKAELKDKKWCIDYNLSNSNMVGGGPHYIISGQTGLIVSKKYEQ